MKNGNRRTVGWIVSGSPLALALGGCDGLFVEQLLIGAREAAVVTTTGIVEGFFESRFGLEPGEAEEADGEEEGHEESGDDLFIRL